MICPECGGKLGVTDTTYIKSTNDIYRLRKCFECGEKIASIEKIVPLDNDFRFLWNEYNRNTRKNRKAKKEKENVLF